MSSWPAPERQKTPRVTDERTSLETWLEYYRTTLLVKCAGLTPDQLVTLSCSPSTLSLLGLVRHMAEVESWFHVFDGEPVDYLYCSKERPDADLEDLDPTRADEDLATYQACAERSRPPAGAYDLVPDPSPEPSARNLRGTPLHGLVHDRGQKRPLCGQSWP